MPAGGGLEEAAVAERFPWPSLKSYVTVSWLLLATVLGHALHDVRDRPVPVPAVPYGPLNEGEEPLQPIQPTEETAPLAWQVVRAALEDQLSSWLVLNWLISVAAVLGWATVSAIFGRLRSPELAALKERFWNLVFYKFVFVFGILGVEKTDEAGAWLLWLTGAGLLLMLSSLSEDRLSFCHVGGRRP